MYLIIGYIALASSVFPIFSAPIVNGEWDYNAWNNQVAYLEQTGWVDDGWTTVIVSHTYGPLYEVTQYTDESVYIYFENYIYRYTLEYTDTISAYSELQSYLSLRDNLLILMICDPYIEINRWLYVFKLQEKTYTGSYIYDISNRILVEVG